MHQITQVNDAANFIFLKLIPIAEVFFRPEEVHCASRVGLVQQPLAKGNGDVANQTRGLLGRYRAVLNHHLDGLAAIHAYSVDLDALARKQPADR